MSQQRRIFHRMFPLNMTGAPMRWATLPAFTVSKLRQREVGWFGQSHVLIRIWILTQITELLSGRATTEWGTDPSSLNHLPWSTILLSFSIPRPGEIGSK